MTKAECEAARAWAERFARMSGQDTSPFPKVTTGLCEMLERAAGIIKHSDPYGAPGSAVVDEYREWLEEWDR